MPRTIPTPPCCVSGASFSDNCLHTSGHPDRHNPHGRAPLAFGGSDDAPVRSMHMVQTCLPSPDCGASGWSSRKNPNPILRVHPARRHRQAAEAERKPDGGSPAGQPCGFGDFAGRGHRLDRFVHRILPHAMPSVGKHGGGLSPRSGETGRMARGPRSGQPHDPRAGRLCRMAARARRRPALPGISSR